MSQVTTESIIQKVRALIKDIGKYIDGDVFTYDDNNVFHLGSDYVIEATITVAINGEDTVGFTYDSDTNEVTISATLTKNDTILIKYKAYDKYSDTEILEYINASLIYFNIYRYSKTFIVISGNIVNLSGANPTVEEGNIIAIITAIEIDPKNVNIKSQDFSITAEENLSKSEQIGNVFSVWLRNFGIFNNVEIDGCTECI
jgi:hypothetical protein